MGIRDRGPRFERYGLNSHSLRLAAVEAKVRQQTPATMSHSGPNFLQAAIPIIPKNTAVVAWTTFNAASYIPDGVRTAIVETDWAISSPDSGDKDAYIKFRASLDTLEIVGSRGRASGGSDNIAGSNQVMVPMTANRSFDFWIENPGFDQGATMRLIGYFA